MPTAERSAVVCCLSAADLWCSRLLGLHRGGNPQVGGGIRDCAVGAIRPILRAPIEPAAHSLRIGGFDISVGA